jgi:hypothetical protein
VGVLVICTLTEVFLKLTEVLLTLTEGFPCFFLSYKANARVKLAKTGHGPHYSTLVVICVVRLLFVLFYVLFVCKCILPPGDNPFAVSKYIISYIIFEMRCQQNIQKHSRTLAQNSKFRRIKHMNIQNTCVLNSHVFQLNFNFLHNFMAVFRPVIMQWTILRAL